MRFLPCFLISGLAGFAGTALADAPSKVTYPQKVAAEAMTEDPYRFNGVVFSGEGRGSGFCAWNARTFFSAAHVVYDGSWAAPPEWLGGANADTVDMEDAVQSRGYFRWRAYADLADAYGTTHSRTFGKDVILAYALTDLVTGPPAEMDLKGYQNFLKPNPVMITGYPAIIAYTGETNTFFLHQTGPVEISFQPDATRYLGTTLISTGPGNSGGPVWLEGADSIWRAAGVLVSGLGGETGIYAFSPDVKSLTRSAAPVVKDVPSQPVSVSGVGRSSFVFPMTKPRKIPDGVARSTGFRFNVNKFDVDQKVTKVLLSLDIDTAHRGDLIVYLQGPGGAWAQITKEEGAAEQDLVLTDEDFSSAFNGIEANGQWTLYVQDRLKGDIATVNRIILEIGCD